MIEKYSHVKFNYNKSDQELSKLDKYFAYMNLDENKEA